MPTVSIIIPFFNPGDFFPEAIESVFAQTYSDWELLLVNDGSSDNSVAVANDFARLRPAQVMLLQHPGGANHGLPATRNVGVRQARGEFIALLDADDFWFPDKLAEQVAALREHPQAGMVFGRSEYWHTWNPTEREDDFIPQIVPGGRVYMPPELWTLCYPFGGYGSPCPSDLLLRKAVVEEVGGFEECFDRRYPTHEDIAFLSKVFLSTPVYVSSKVWDRYRRHSDSLWAKAQEDGSEERSRGFYFRWMEAYLDRIGMKDASLWERYREKSWPYRHRALAACAEQLKSALRPIRRFIRS
jgi:glycosyltransferase involved in cell wall biosynthesis